MIRILNIEPEAYCSEARAILDQIGVVDEHELGPKGLLNHVANYEVLIVRLKNQIGREVIDRASQLKAIVTATTGLDHIDTQYAESRGVAVLSLKGETEFLESVHATAEHTLGLLLALVRRIPSAHDSVKRGEWDRDRFRGRELAGAQLGLLGLGRVARRVARYGLAFDMSVHAYDPYATRWAEGVTHHSTLESLLVSSIILSIHIPLNSQTKGSIDDKHLGLLPAGSWLINTSRGELVDEKALLRALTSGRLAGAALDVLSEERTNLGGNQLLDYAEQHENLLITPHIGGVTWESMKKTEIFMANKLAQFFGVNASLRRSHAQ